MSGYRHKIDEQGAGTASIAPLDTPEPIPALVARSTPVTPLAGVRDGVVGLGPDLSERALARVGEARVLPRVGGEGVLVDLGVLDRVTDPARSEASHEVWLAPMSAAEEARVVDDLSRRGVEVVASRSLATVADGYRRSETTRASSATLVVAAAALLLTGGNVLALVLYIVVGVMLGFLLLLIVLGRRAERAAYSQIAGQPGAVGAVMKSGLRRSWRAAEMPVAVQGRSQAAVYRAVGKGGVVLIGEGSVAQTKKLVEEERRKVARILPNVPITVLHVGPDAESVPLHKIAGRMNKIKSSLNRNEVLAVSNRLQSLGKNGLPIPKGVDPFKVRAGRPR